MLAHYNVGSITTRFGDGRWACAACTPTRRLPFNGTIALGGGYPPNSWEQNQYYVFTGNGPERDRDGELRAGHVDRGVPARGVRGLGGQHHDRHGTFTFPSQAGAVYVLVVQGYGQVSGNYNVTLSITSP